MALTGPITACNFRRHVVRFSSVFENIFVGQLMSAEKMADFSMTHERFLLPDTVSQYCRQTFISCVSLVQIMYDIWNQENKNNNAFLTAIF